ncbi:hypothetical protein Hypma_004425 [Hypsizygus marmoreus]|uniref:Uncharacterized protein n=1 Tax=Hypsizygus marmoreus TaxID=39966 RepID=A0A369K3I3_HYPMA|nr:hypothetical protein Hypma_004425 [Hypsizygus marmoreus]
MDVCIDIVGGQVVKVVFLVVHGSALLCTVHKRIWRVSLTNARIVSLLTLLIETTMAMLSVTCDAWTLTTVASCDSWTLSFSSFEFVQLVHSDPYIASPPNHTFRQTYRLSACTHIHQIRKHCLEEPVSLSLRSEF